MNSSEHKVLSYKKETKKHRTNKGKIFSFFNKLAMNDEI